MRNNIIKKQIVNSVIQKKAKKIKLFSAREILEGWDPKACYLWENGQRVEAVQAAINSLNNNTSKPSQLYTQISYYLFLLNDFKSAVTMIEQQAKLFPEDMEVLQNLSVCYTRINRYKDAVLSAEKVLNRAPDNYMALDVLSKSLYKLGREDEASEAGTQSLEVKDKLASKPVKNWKLPTGTPGSFARSNDKRDVISFSLWGNKPQYLRGALRNLILGEKLYPDWEIRFYLDESVPSEFIGLIETSGGKVFIKNSNQPIRKKLSWRFQVANDPGVGYFLVRDADSVFSTREVQAVTTWQGSDSWFHVVRDWWTHTDLVLAGLWGGIAGVLPSLEKMFDNYQSRHAETPNIDQWFLRDRVWSYIKRSCLVHDRCFRMAGSVPVPGIIPRGNLHIGQNEMVARGRAQERFLRPWIEKYPCLGPLKWPK